VPEDSSSCDERLSLEPAPPFGWVKGHLWHRTGKQLGLQQRDFSPYHLSGSTTTA